MTARLITNRPAPAELRRLYVEEKKGCPEIALAIGCDPSTVRQWLVDAGISTRPRGENNRFQPGQRSPWKGQKHTAEAKEKVGAASKARWDDGTMAKRRHWLKDAPPELNPRWLGGVTAERQAFYNSRPWKVACVAVWARADACCERCGLDSRLSPRPAQGAFHIHHIVSFKVVELRADPRNLALLCRVCHLWVHSRANAGREWIAADASALLARELSAPTFFDLLDAQKEAA